MANQKVIIIGAGLSGSLLAIYLAKRGIGVDVYEARGDMRHETVAAGRSINLALSNRGIRALSEVGLDEYMLAEAVPMFGRMIHATDGATKLLPYSGRSGEFINSISRSGLNIALINEAEKCPNVRFHFNERCVGFDCRTGEARLESGLHVTADTIFGTDGAGSVIRNAMMRDVPRFDYSVHWLEHGYKELHIPAADGGGFRIGKNALHIWARHSFMMIALPNFDGSFTVTMFLAHEGADSFEEIDSGAGPLPFFEKYFPDSIEHLPTLAEDYRANPIGNLGTVKCYPWNVGRKSLLIGDAAHAVVPFYGQGMNASFEDCRILNDLIGKHGTDWERVFGEFVASRKRDADAIADMAEENFYEMRDAVADPVFQRKRELETRLEHEFPDYYSKYSMVTFRDDLPYSVAQRRGNAQDRFLMDLCAGIDDVDTVDIRSILSQLETLEIR